MDILDFLQKTNDKELNKSKMNDKKSLPTPRLFDKDGGEIRPFTPDDFNRERPKR